MDDVPHDERVQMQRIRELDKEQLEVEEVDTDWSDDDSLEGRGDGGAGPYGGFTFDTSLATMHSYLGDIDDITCRRSFLDGGSLLILPMFYLEGIVLFPEATLPLRVIQPRFKAAVEIAMLQEEAPCTIGVIHVRGRPQNSNLQCALVGTTAEIRQLRHLEDGSINVVTRGKQRFRTLNAWTNADGAPCAQVQIIPEDMPLPIPRDAFGVLASVPNFQSGKVPKAELKSNLHDVHSESDLEKPEDEISDDEDIDFAVKQQRARDIMDIFNPSDIVDDDSGSEGETIQRWWWSHRRDRRNSPTPPRQEERNRRRSDAHGNVSDHVISPGSLAGRSSIIKRTRAEGGWGGACKAWASDESKWMYRIQRTAWPHWVYRMYDAYNLARRAADMWRQIVELPGIYDMVKRPEILSYHIASKIPVQDATRQELLEIDGVVPRLRREIQLLESLDRIRCKNCMTVIARRSDMLVMSSDGPMGAYVNNYGYVHETLTLSKAHGLNLQGQPETQHSWFPGYSWTIAYCNCCESHMGWLFKAIKKNMYPRQFWGVRRSQLAENSS